MPCIARGGLLATDGDAVSRSARRAGFQCTQPDPADWEGRCRWVTTHVYLRRVTTGGQSGRTCEIPCCPSHYEALIEAHGPDGGRP